MESLTVTIKLESQLVSQKRLIFSQSNYDKERGVETHDLNHTVISEKQGVSFNSLLLVSV